VLRSSRKGKQVMGSSSKGEEIMVDDSPPAFPNIAGGTSLENKFNMQASVVQTLEENVDFLLKSTIKETGSNPNVDLKDESDTLETKFKALEEKYNNCLAMNNVIMDLMHVHIHKIYDSSGIPDMTWKNKKITRNFKASNWDPTIAIALKLYQAFRVAVKVFSKFFG
ncbi:hypothetical protein KI387_041304, partial [Taxus chinensis]